MEAEVGAARHGLVHQAVRLGKLESALGECHRFVVPADLPEERPATLDEIDHDVDESSIDWNTIGLLTGMMILVSISRRSGMFQYLAIWSAQAAKAHPAGILFILQITTAVLSAFLDNVTTVLLIVPVTLAICKTLKVPAYPYLFAEIFASNIGGTATLIGDPPNILIGSQVGLSFNDFVFHLTPVIIVVMVGAGGHDPSGMGPRSQGLKGRRDSRDGDARHADHQGLAAAQAIAGRAHRRDGRLRAGAAAASGAGHHRHARRRHSDAARQLGASHREGRAQYPSRPSATSNGSPSSSSSACSSWCTASTSAACSLCSPTKLVAATGGNMAHAGYAILWASAVLSAIVDNIPFVATMIPLIKNMAPSFGGADHIQPLWWCLSLGACLGGNGTLIGASANLTVAGIGERNEVPFSFITYTLYAFPMMLVSVAICHVYVWWRYFMIPKLAAAFTTLPNRAFTAFRFAR